MKKLYVMMAAMILAGCSSQPGAETAEGTQAPNNEQQTASAAAPSSESKVEIIKDNRSGIIPATIEIPAINVKTKIEQVGIMKDGRMDVPKDPDNVGWYEPGTLPGAPGNAVLAGHVDDLTSPAVFYELHKLKNGDKIMLTNAKGQTLTFEVYDQKTFPRLDAPIEDIFGFSYASTLNLITCSGDYDAETTERAERTVIYTKLVEEKKDSL